MSLLMILLTRGNTTLGKVEHVFELLLNSTDNINFWWLSASFCCRTDHTKINNLNNNCLICQRRTGWLSSGWISAGPAHACVVHWPVGWDLLVQDGLS